MAWKEDKTSAPTHKVEQVSSHSSSPKLTLRTKLKAHCKKWWWVYLLVFVAITIILVLCLVYPIFHRIAQDNLNKSTLTITSLVLSNPKANSFHLFQNSTVGNPSAYHPQLDAFNASVALHGGKPYASIEIPHLHATRKAISIVDQDVTITDMDAFLAYNAAVLSQEEVKVNVRGKTKLHEMKFPATTVDYRKTATMKGLNKLSGFNVTSFEIKLTPDPDGANMVGEVYIPNPSDMTLSMGNVTFTNLLPATASTPSTPIGTSTLANLVLVPGNNTVPMRATVNQTLVIQAIATVYTNGMLPVDIVGESSVYDGQHLPYFEKALQGLTQHVTLNVGAALKAAGIDPSVLTALGGG
ncbi:MAG: hypothetical protein Q9163_004210 [Psora crenata]